MSQDEKFAISAATDGACSGNPGPGGWGALIRFQDGSEVEFGGFSPETTNNRMELQAALFVLEKFKQIKFDPSMTIKTDSKYLIDGLGSWMAGWKRKGWKTAAGKPVLNKDLWQALDQARLADVPLRYVKGHSGDPDNDRVDQIAVAYSKGTAPRFRQDSDSVAFSTAATATAEEAAPAPLQRLLTRLELADRLAAGGYGLSAPELAQLVEQPLTRLAERQQPWRWRDWLVEPLEGDRWRLRRAEAGSG